jgi:pimeloyl-ACP methyl ester carboxylesterase
LRTLLAIYGGIQTAWKIVQWLVLTPIVLGLLVLISVLQVFSFIGFIRSALVKSFNALTSYVMLHWIASTQVYMRDYSLSAEIRQRFEREVAAFLRDARCDRVVVIAHSMGTVIAYEGLTTLLSEPESQSEEKPITFICLAQALRRVWLLPGIDARRLHGVLPERVRWIHF